MPTEIEDIPLLHDETLRGDARAEELLHEAERLRGRNDRRLRPGGERLRDVRRMVRLHVVDHEVVRRLAAVRRRHVPHPFVAEARIDGIHHRRLCVLHQIAVVRHATRHHVLSLKQIDVVVVHAHRNDIRRDFHTFISP